MKTNMGYWNYLTVSAEINIDRYQTPKLISQFIGSLERPGWEGLWHGITSPTVEPDPDNAGGGKAITQVARFPGGLFLSVSPVGPQARKPVVPVKPVKFLRSVGP